MSGGQENLKQVAAFSEPYRAEYLESVGDTKPGNDPFRLRFFLKKAMAGARHESTSATYRKAAETVLRENQDRIKRRLNGEDVFPDSELESELKDAGLTNGADRQMVIDIIDLLADINDDHDIVAYTRERIETGGIEVIHDRLTDIHNIAQKKAALFLRDVVTIWDLEDQLSWAEYRYVFPVDTQVRQVATELGIVDDGVSRNQLIDAILEACRPDVSPVELNQGAWYLGANAFDVVMNNLAGLDPSSRS